MRVRWQTILFFLALGPSACTSPSSSGAETSPYRGQFAVTWLLEPPANSGFYGTCADLAVDHVVATIKSVTGDVMSATTSACDESLLLTDPLPLGEYSISLDAFGAAGDHANSAPVSTNGWLLTDGQEAGLPLVHIPVAAPLTSVLLTWNLTHDGQPTRCDQIPYLEGVEIGLTTGSNEPEFGFYDCDPQSAEVDNQPFGTTLTGYLASTTEGQTLGMSSPIALPAVRGSVDVTLNIAW